MHRYALEMSRHRTGELDAKKTRPVVVSPPSAILEARLASLLFAVAGVRRPQPSILLPGFSL